jgi:hypothetical protein
VQDHDIVAQNGEKDLAGVFAKLAQDPGSDEAGVAQ